MPQRQLQDSPLKILILDNSVDILELLTTDLQCRGCIVITGSVSAIRHGEIDGAHLIETTAPDVVVFDVALPYEANWHVATELQADPRVRVPFVLTTTNAIAVQRLVGQNLIELVGKPYDLDSLYDVIVRSVFPAMTETVAEPPVADPATLLVSQAVPEQSEGLTRSELAPGTSTGDADRRTGVDRRSVVRRQPASVEPEFL